MGRNEIREAQRKQAKAIAWANNLSLEQQIIIEHIVETKVSKNGEIVEKIVNDCFGTAISDYFKFLSIKKVNNILLNANYYIEDYRKAVDENEGDLNMMEDKKIIAAIEKRMLVMIKADKNKVEGIKELRKEFRIPQNELVNIWTDLKLKKNIGTIDYSRTNKATEKEKEELINTIGRSKEPLGKVKKEVKPIVKEETTKELPYVVSEKQIERSQKKIEKCNELGYALTIEANKVELKLPNKLKVISTTIEVQGQYGTYIKGSEGVKIGNKIYKDKTDVLTQSNSLHATTSSKIEELYNNLNEINKEIHDLKERENQENGLLEEIELVFAM